MRLVEPALRLSIVLRCDDRWHHQPLYGEIVERARDAGLAGATVLYGCEGYSGASLIHTDRTVDLADNLPVVVIIIDTEERVRAFLPRLDELVTDGTILLDQVHVVRHQGKS
ncbi:DUF190 domain-containing protein [Kibdelosporangium aridum]|uniref:DUF190 domain-containing protein n=1 Tax=Kibdelosporangium aridum TaxID=2030 RepID=UPI000A012187|nr:DUF190 domain-containing protein [Kibdelosporangium aridum]